MNYLKSFIFGLILSIIGGGILYVAKDKYDWLEFDPKYVFAIFLIGYLIQTLLGVFGMEDWYCFTGLCNKQVNDVKIESDVQDLTDIDELIDLDEITSGFKDNYGGLHLKLKVNPDIAIFGKSIGNGYPISAIIGRKEIMQVVRIS